MGEREGKRSREAADEAVRVNSSAGGVVLSYCCSPLSRAVGRGRCGRAENDGRTKDARALASAGDGFACVAERSRGMVVKHHRRLGFFYHLAKQVCLGDFGRGGLEEEGKGLTGLLAKELELEEAESICRLATTDGCISICLAAPRRIRYKDLFGFVNFKSWMLVLSRKNVQITTKCRCT